MKSYRVIFTSNWYFNKFYVFLSTTEWTSKVPICDIVFNRIVSAKTKHEAIKTAKRQFNQF
jgi:hypothetical protein